MTKENLKAGFISLLAYLPAKKLSAAFTAKLIRFLQTHTLLPDEYVSYIKENQQLPGSVETNDEGWRNKPWFEAWVNSLSEKKQKDPFQGAVERRRVPLDPDSVRNSVYPHPMLPSDAETLACAMAICSANVNPDEIDLVMSHSQVPDHPLP